MVCSRQSIGWCELWRSCCPSCQIFGAVRFEPRRSFLDSPRERRCSCAIDFWPIVVKPRRRKTTRTYYRFWKSRLNNELRCIGFGWLRSPISINQESEDNIELLPLYHVPCVTLCTLSLSCQTTLTKRQKKKKKKKKIVRCQCTTKLTQIWPRMSVNTKMEHRTLAWVLVITPTRVHLSESVSRKDSERKMF